MMDAIHRMLTGQTATRGELIIAGTLVLIWFAIDLHQYIAWLFETGCK